MIKDIRLELMKLFYNNYNNKENYPFLDEMESFFDILKYADNMNIKDLEIPLKKLKPHNITKGGNFPANDKNNINTILQILELDTLDYENITIDQIRLLESKDSITKTLAMKLAKEIGISKNSYKTRKEVFDDIFRMINNRDTMNATKNALSNDLTETDNNNI